MVLEKSATSNEPGLVNTASRLFDVTYRVNAGIINTVGQKVQDITDKKNWVRKIIFHITDSRLGFSVGSQRFSYLIVF